MVETTRFADILVSGADATPQLAVEVKGRVGSSPDWATRLRRNLAVHHFLPSTPYFMLAVPDRFYVWKQDSDHWDAPANYVVDARRYLQPYMSSIWYGDRWPSAPALELAVGAWLNNLVHGDEPNRDPDHAWLLESGLFESIRNGSVSTQARS